MRLLSLFVPAVVLGRVNVDEITNLSNSIVRGEQDPEFKQKEQRLFPLVEEILSQNSFVADFKRYLENKRQEQSEENPVQPISNNVSQEAQAALKVVSEQNKAAPEAATKATILKRKQEETKARFEAAKKQSDSLNGLTDWEKAARFNPVTAGTEPVKNNAKGRSFNPNYEAREKAKREAR